jgi:pyruvate/2-oxoacid:ferredoxin oxidoreductase beta subunit
MTPTLITTAQNTWCPGCGNFAIQHMAKRGDRQAAIRERLNGAV